MRKECYVNVYIVIYNRYFSSNILSYRFIVLKLNVIIKHLPISKDPTNVPTKYIIACRIPNPVIGIPTNDINVLNHVF